VLIVVVNDVSVIVLNHCQFICRTKVRTVKDSEKKPHFTFGFLSQVKFCHERNFICCRIFNPNCRKRETII